MSTSVADIFEDYVESLQNLPSEIDQNMHELRSMDEEFQTRLSKANYEDIIGYREIYTKHRRSYTKLFRSSSNSTPSINLVASRLQLEKDYKTAVQKQDQKIELTKRMYELVSRHIERLDSQVAKSGLSESDWISQRVRKGPTWIDSTGHRKRTLSPMDGAIRKRTHHSSRPNPLSGHATVGELEIDPNEPTYCYCSQVSFGDMIACDGENCEKEWFHYACVGLVKPPTGKWFCEDCKAEEEYRQQMKLSDEEDSS